MYQCVSLVFFFVVLYAEKKCSYASPARRWAGGSYVGLARRGTPASSSYCYPPWPSPVSSMGLGRGAIPTKNPALALTPPPVHGWKMVEQVWPSPRLSGPCKAGGGSPPIARLAPGEGALYHKLKYFFGLWYIPALQGTWLLHHKLKKYYLFFKFKDIFFVQATMEPYR